MSIKLYNNFSNKKEEFVPIEESKVKFYMCGPTVYDYIHVGNARAFIVFDVLRRFFEFLGFEVTYALNLTDIDDKIINRAAAEGADTKEISKKYATAFLEDLDALGIKPATVNPRATEHLPEIISLIQTLLEKSYAYQVDGNVFFDVSTFECYGRLSGKKTEDLRAGARVEVDSSKRNPLDFVLWKSQKPGEPAWGSPWGMGRPGWHIECSAMSMKYLGETFDIHAGGADLIFPHHENEIAQSECATGKKFVRYWLHNGFLKIDGDKMSKSLGNFKTVRNVLKHYPGSVLRMFFLQKHYRSPIDLTEDGLEAARSAVVRLNGFHRNLTAKLKGLPTMEKNNPADLGPYHRLRRAFIDAMSDDLNSPAALSVLFEIVRTGNRLLALSNPQPHDIAALQFIKELVDAIDEVLALLNLESDTMNDALIDDLMSILIHVRQELRAKKEWQMADKIRDLLAERGVVMEDRDGGTGWYLKTAESVPKSS